MSTITAPEKLVRATSGMTEELLAAERRKFPPAAKAPHQVKTMASSPSK